MRKLWPRRESACAWYSKPRLELQKTLTPGAGNAGHRRSAVGSGRGVWPRTGVVLL